MRKYYKYIIDSTTISIPTFDSTTEAVNGKNGFKIISNIDTYQIYGNTSYSSKYVHYTDTEYTIIDFGGLSNLRTYSFRGYGASGYSYEAGLLSIEASINLKDWTTLYSGSYQSTNIGTTNYSDTTNLYRYLKVTFKHNPSEINVQRSAVAYFNTSIQNRHTEIEADETDYDFYRDIYIYKLPCKKFVKRLYYDYTKPWEQPVCSSNTSHGTFTGGGYFSEGSGDRAYYHVSDNSWPTSPIGGGWDGTCWGTTHSASGWFNWELPETIRITGIKVMARNYSQSSTDYVVSNARFYTASDKVTPIGDTFNLTTCGQQLDIVNIPEDGILTNNIYFYKGGGGEYSGFAEIWITAYALQEISASEYEQGTAFAYYTDINTYDTKGFKYKDGLKYYKYTYNTWNQPILSDYTNGTFKVSASKETQAETNPYRAWEAFDNNSSTYWRSGTTSGWIMFENKNPLNVTSLTWGYFYSYPTGGNVEVSNDGITFMEIQTWTNNSGADFTVNLSNNTGYYKYYRININGVNTDVIHLKQLGITATERLSVETDETDYEFTKPYHRKYYKYNYSTFIQPTLSANGTIGGDSFAVYTPHGEYGSCYLYKAFDNTSYTYWENTTNVSKDGYLHWYLYIYNPTPLKLSEVTIDFRYQAGSGYRSTYTRIYGSNNNSSWVEIGQAFSNSGNVVTQAISGDEFYKYLWFDFYGGGTSGYITMNQLTLTATQSATVESTSSDYDYYEDIIGYRYKALKF